jgi:hypothetical protein
MGLRTGSDAMVERKIPCPCQKSNPSHPAHSLVAILTSCTGSLIVHHYQFLDDVHSTHNKY